MQTNQSMQLPIPEPPPDDQLPEIVSKSMALLGRIQECAIEMAALLAALQEAHPKRKVRELDGNGEPTWNFAVKVTLPKDIFLTKTFRAYAEKQNIKGKDLDDVWEGFVNWYSREKTKWAHWSKVWFDWCRRERKRRDEKGGNPIAPLRTSKSLREF